MEKFIRIMLTMNERCWNDLGTKKFCPPKSLNMTFSIVNIINLFFISSAEAETLWLDVKAILGVVIWIALFYNT